MELTNMLTDPHAVPFGMFGSFLFMAGIWTFWYINQDIDPDETEKAYVANEDRGKQHNS